MTDHIPSTPRAANPVPDFIPVPRRSKRFDGWTVIRQRAFIAALAETGSVTAAAAVVGKSPEGAYALRRAPGAHSFDKAWDAALDDGVRRLAAIAFSRASEGVPIPLMHGGIQVGEKRAYSDGLLMFLLRHHDPAKYGANPGLRPGTIGASRRAQEETGMSLEQARAEADVARASIAEKLRRTRNLYVRTIAHDRKKRAAWDRLCPRVDWNIAAQDFTTCLLPDGTEAPLFLDQVDRAFPNLHRPEFIIPIANGFAPDLSDPSYDPDGDPLRQLVQSITDHAPPADGTGDDDDDGIDIDEATARIRRAHGLGDFVPDQQPPGQDDERAGD